MKRSNFIQPVTLPWQKEIRFWYWLCFVISSMVLIHCAITSYLQWQLYYSLTHQAQELRYQLEQYTATMTEQRQLLEEQQQLQKKIDTINRYKKNPKNPLSILKTIRTIMRPMTIETITISTKQCTIHALCSSIAQVTTCLAQLTKEARCNNVTLTSLQKNQDTTHITITFAITGALKEVNNT